MENASILNGVSLSIILLTPFLANTGISMEFVGNILVRMGLVAYVVYASYTSLFSGLLAFLAVFTLLLQRNHGILTGFPDVRAEIPRTKYQVDEVPVGTPSIVKGEPEMDDDNAENLVDNIPRLEMVPRGASSASFYQQRSL
jgi:hypothetical protein